MRSANDVIHGLVLLAVVLALFVPTLPYEFVYDDHQYIEINSHMDDGLTPENASWACTTYYFCNWHPLTWLSYMLDTSIFGKVPWGYRLTNIVLHVINTALVFLLSRELTGRKGLAWWMAGVFALHPLHIESVVWIASRKDVLSILFGLWAMLMYLRYTRQPTRKRYLAVCGLLLLSLLAKQTLITFPFLLLLLDVWPLNRLQLFEPGWPQRLRKLVIEKLPMLAMSIFFGVAIINAQSEGGALRTDVDLSVRLINTVNGFSTYLQLAAWPSELCPFYPHPFDELQIDGWWIARATLLATVCVLALASWFVRKDTETAYLASGWFWFLGTLLPMVGMIQLGSASHADRYMYFPLIGLSLLIGMFAVRLGTVVPGILKQLIPVAMYGSLVLMAWATSQQLPYWQNDVILFRRALAVTEDNMYSRVNLSAGLITQAKLLIEEDQPEAARKLLLEAYDHAEAGRQLIVIPAVYYDLVTSQRMLGEFAEAARIGRIAVERYPDNAGMWYILGDVYRESGDTEQAAECYRRSLDHKPKMIDSFLRLAELFSVSDPAQAEGWLRGALAVDPDHVEARRTLGDLLLSQGRVDEAIVHYEHALEIEPENVELRESLSNAEETLSGQGH